MDIKDCLPDGAGTCRNEAMIEELRASREADWRRFVELTHDEQIAELERRWQQAEAWSRLWKRTAKTRRAWCDRYKDRAEQAESELQESLSLLEGWCEWYVRADPVMQQAEATNARLRAALLASLAVMRHVPHGQTLTDGEFVELQTAKRLADEALEGAP